MKDTHSSMMQNRATKVSPSGKLTGAASTMSFVWGWVEEEEKK